VQINSSRGDSTLHGTGSIVAIDGSTATILSCAHILKAGYPPVILYADGFQASATLLSADALNDVSMLTAPCNANAEHVKIVDAPPAGQGVSWCGYAATGYASGAGNVIGFEGETLVFSGKVPEGTSGGPVYVPGGIVGVLSECRQAQGQPWQTFAPSPNILRRAIAAAAAQPKTGVETSATAFGSLSAIQTASSANQVAAKPAVSTPVQPYDDRPLKTAVESLRARIEEVKTNLAAKADEKPLLEAIAKFSQQAKSEVDAATQKSRR
jgi:hypothetical protein